MNLFKRVTTIVIVICGFFMIGLPLSIYAQSSGNIDNNPIIIMDKKLIAIDRQNLKSAQASGATEAVKFNKQKLQQDINKLKVDKVSLKNYQKRISNLNLQK